MRIRRVSPIDPKILVALSEMRKKNAKEAHELRFPLAFLTTGLGVKETTVRNWLSRGVFEDLDAERDRAGLEWREFSQRDAVAIATASELSRLGVPPAGFKTALARIMPIADHYLTGPIVARVSAGPPSPFRESYLALFTVENGWDAIMIVDGRAVGEGHPPIPAAYVLLRIDQLLDRCFGAMGLTVFAGTAKEMRAKADELDALIGGK